MKKEERMEKWQKEDYERGLYEEAEREDCFVNNWFDGVLCSSCGSYNRCLAQDEHIPTHNPYVK
jgi:hypothetical protein